MRKTETEAAAVQTAGAAAGAGIDRILEQIDGDMIDMWHEMYVNNRYVA